MTLVDLMYEEADNEHPIESQVPFNVVPRVGEAFHLNAAPSEWHSFPLEECRFIVRKVVHRVEIDPLSEEATQDVRHGVELFLQATNEHTGEMLLRLKAEQGKLKKG